MTRIRTSKAFTLIELIVVVVIIGVLAGIAAVSYQSIINVADSTAVEAQAVQAAKIVQAQSAKDRAQADDAFVEGLRTTLAADGVDVAWVTGTDTADTDATGFIVTDGEFSYNVAYGTGAGSPLVVTELP